MVLLSFRNAVPTVKAVIMLLGISCIYCTSTGSKNSTAKCDSVIKSIIKASNGKETGDVKVRLTRFAAWLKEKNTPCSTMVKAVEERSQTLRDTIVYPIDTSVVTFVGAADAPQTIILFYSASCPSCKKLYKSLYDSVVTGRLKGKARLGIKPFSANPGDLAVFASRKFGKQADLMLLLASVKGRLSMADLLKKADSIGIPEKEFKKAIDDLDLFDAAVECWKEAVGMGIIVTPGIVIDGHKYASDKDARWVVDAVEYWYKKEMRGEKKKG